MPMPSPSWTLPSPVVFTASNPHACDGHKVGTVLTIIDRSDGRPDWNAVGHTARVYQVEGAAEVGPALTELELDDSTHANADGRAVVTTLGIDPAPFVKLGVTSCMVECYAQAGNDPYANIQRMRWQAKHDGWPHVIPVLGVYDDVGLQRYIDLNGGPAAFRGGHWRGGPLAIYLGEGMTDTGSWVTLAGLNP